ncbi:MAG: 2-isopropylmalate synthase [Spirochaetia bacterium]|nr:2-isopropylmalate synthase [Spirochaetia bacterium]
MKPFDIEILDTTLRDGEQTHNVSFTNAEKLHIARILLERVHVDRIEIASARVSKGEEESVKNIISWAKKTNKDYLERIEILGFVDGTHSVDWIKKTGAKILNLLTKGSLKHLKGQLRKTPEEHFRDIEKTILYAHKNKISVNIYLEDFSNGYLSSVNYVYDIISFLSNLPVKRIMLPDTLGIMYPKTVYDSIYDISNRFKNIHFDFHPHNDYGLGTVNVLESIKAGAKGVHVTVNCLGERAGNASLAEVTANIHDNLKLKTRIHEKSLTLISGVVETLSGKRVSPNAPVIGEDVFTQTAGIHADGDKKGGLYENPLIPQRFGRKRSYALGKLAGKASIEHNLKNMGIDLSEENKKRVLEKIVELGDQKKTVTAEDLPFIVADVLKIPRHIKLHIEKAVITSGKGMYAVCSLKLKYKNEEYNITGNGDGGYDAFMNAISGWAEKQKIIMPKLIDYEVRIPPGGKTSALVECKISWQPDIKKNEHTITTIGIDSDQVLAAVNATERMLNIILS